jgi:phage terminase large subunit
MNANRHGAPNTTAARAPAEARRDRRALERFTGLCDQVNTRFLQESWRWRMRSYRKNPAAFAREILGSDWWAMQERVARSLVTHRRVAVKSANGVGKTYLAADLALWFLYSHQPAVVLTTAPTWRQVRHVLWQEIRRRHRQAHVRLPGKMLTARLDAGDGWFALGLATTEADKFQGFHAENLLIIFEEASGIPDTLWDAAEGIAVAGNNKILAIGNPLATTGRFYRVFQRANAWHKLTITALDHPNLSGKGSPIPGAVTHQSVQERINEWCEPILNTTPAEYLKETPSEPPFVRQDDRPQAHQRGQFIASLTPAAPDAANSQETFAWQGRTYRPNNLFRARVLGQFPSADDETLIPLRWIESAFKPDEQSLKPGDPEPAARCHLHSSRITHHASRAPHKASPIRLAADIARFGDDDTVIGWRIGQDLQNMETMHGLDLMQVAGRIRLLAYELHPESIAVDVIGLGAGVVDRLREMEIEGVQPINVGRAAHDPERFANRRAELYWGLRERFRLGEIALPRLPDSDRLVEELASIKYRITSRGQIQIESKDQMKKRGTGSPDHADMLAMLFDSSLDWLPVDITSPTASCAAHLRAEMHGW